MAQAAVILTNYRTGGTFLSLCLDSHPLIFCQRMEPLSHNSVFAKNFGHPDRTAILKTIFDHRVCRIAMAKVVYRQCGGHVWKLLQDRDAKIVHLIRDNQFRAAVSHEFHLMAMRALTDKSRSLHNFDRGKKKPPPQVLDPNTVIALCRKRDKEFRRIKKQMANRNLPIHTIYYEHFTQGQDIEAIPEEYARPLCKFLRVPYYPLSAPYMHRVNDWPLSELIANWHEFKSVIQESAYGKWLEREE